jgi:type II secretion system protein C
MHSRFAGAAWLVLIGCSHRGAVAISTAPPAAPEVAQPPAPAAAAAAADHILRRGAVLDAVSKGLGVLLRHVELEDQPVRVDGKFHGFRIAALRDPQFWAGVDLKPGDVVTSVNGFPIERPEQAQTAFESLQVASELRVAYERDGRPHELVYAIVDEK